MNPERTSEAPSCTSGHLITIPGAPPQALHQLQLELIACYQEPPRRWHTLAHIYEMQEVLAALTKTPDPILNCACWFHDVVYVPGRPDNEEQSADLAQQALKLLADPQFIDPVVNCILATARHLQHENLDPRIATFIDADLAVLASPPAEYDFYSAAIRAEYVQIPDNQFYPSRAAFLHALLQRPHLFSPHAPWHWEAKARQNLTREIRSIQDREP